MRNKNVDLEKIASTLDLTPTMYHYAVERYNSLARFLTEKGIQADIYPQGSFRTGTVVRPIKDGKEGDFDIDVVCELSQNLEDSTPCFVKNIVGDVLKHSQEYAPKLRPEEKRCWTLDYADVADGIGLAMDVVPCVHETQCGVLLLTNCSVPEVYAERAVEITERKAQGSYCWLPSNPGGYGLWFEDINRRFLDWNIRERKAQILNENRSLFGVYASVEDVPDDYVKSALQRTIQILKRHRDLFYYNAQKENYRPASVIITTLSAEIAQSASFMALDELLPYVVKGMSDYAELLQGHRPRNESVEGAKYFIGKEGSKWVIRNPVNPVDNYADSWTDETARLFFQWVDAVEDDLGRISPLEEKKYLAGLQRGFGVSTVEKAIGSLVPATPSIIVGQSATKSITPTRSWGV